MNRVSNPIRYEEDNLLMKCVAWADSWFVHSYPEWCVMQERKGSAAAVMIPPLVHTANERKSTPQAGARMKRKGVRAGYPDLVLNVPVFNLSARTQRYCPMMAIEMKSKKGRMTQNQLYWEHFFLRMGAEYHVCRTFEQFKCIVTAYMLRAIKQHNTTQQEPPNENKIRTTTRTAGNV